MDKQRALVFGTGEIAEQILSSVQMDYEIIAFIDNNQDKWGHKFEGFPICSPDTISMIDYDVIIVATVAGCDAVTAQLLNIGIQKDKIDTTFLPFIPHKSNELENIISQQQHVFDLCLLQGSTLFDEAYYSYTYPVSAGVTPVEHYLLEGWKLGYNPSEKFDSKKYLAQYPHVQGNPLVYFLRYGQRFCHVCYFENYFEPKQTLIEKYLKHKSQRISKKVVYVCITGDYDKLTQQQYIDFDYDYVCFTDNKEWLDAGHVGMWETWPLKSTEFDNQRTNRYHKINPHLVLSEYDESVYLDGNINILTPHYFEKINNENKMMLIPKHPCNNCLYHELNGVFIAKIDYADIMKKQYILIKNEGFPMLYGMTDNSIIYRRHKEPQIIAIMKDWWYMVENYCRRDQTSFAYILWKYNMRIEDVSFPNARLELNNYAYIMHVGKDILYKESRSIK